LGKIGGNRKKQTKKYQFIKPILMEKRNLRIKLVLLILMVLTGHDRMVFGRWLSIDPLQKKYPSMSPYCSMGNNPIIFKDIDGRDIIIWYKDALGNDASYKYGSGIKLPDNDFVKSTVAILDQLKSDKNTKGIVGQISRDKSKTLNIKEITTLNRSSLNNCSAHVDFIDPDGNPVTNNRVNPNRSGYTASTGTIMYSPKVGLYITDVDGNPGEVSAATVLLHEIGHIWGGFYFTDQFIDRSVVEVEGFDNAEEQFVIETFEQPYARGRGEGVRRDHRGDFFLSESPLSNVPIRSAPTSPASHSPTSPASPGIPPSGTTGPAEPERPAEPEKRRTP
jgi:hypothetical protein